MAGYTLPTNPDGSLAPFTPAQIEAMDIQLRGPYIDQDHAHYNFGPDGSGVTRKFSCAWDQVFNTLVYFVGACVTYNPTGGTPTVAISRLVPLVDPFWPGWVCTKVEFDPFQFTGEVDAPVTGSMSYPEYTRADFTATFELVPYNIATDATVAYNELERYVTFPGNPGAEITADANYIGLPGGILNYATTDGTSATGPAGRPIPYPAGFVEGSEKFKVIWRRVPQNAWGPTTPLTQLVLGTATTRGYIGSINYALFNDYPSLELQLLGVEQRLLPDPTGLGYSWDLAYVFAHAPKPYGHLGFYFHDARQTNTTATLTVPAVSASVTAAVVSAAGLSVGTPLFFSDGTNAFNGAITSIGSTTSVTVTCAAITSGSAGNTLASGASVSGGQSGYYQVLRPAAGTQYLTPTNLMANPNASLFPVVDFNLLFNVAG